VGAGPPRAGRAVPFHDGEPCRTSGRAPWARRGERFAPQPAEPVLHLTAGRLPATEPEGQRNRDRYSAERQAERQVDELYDLLRGHNVPVVLLQVLRRFAEQKEKQRSFYLPSELTVPEAARFVEVFSRQAPTKRKQLQAVCSSSNKKLCTPFYFGLESFGQDFLGLDQYITNRIEDLSEQQRRILGFLALSHHYAQRPLPAHTSRTFRSPTKAHTCLIACLVGTAQA